MKTVNSSKWHTVRGVCAGILAACMLLSVCIGILPHTVLTTAASTIEEDRQSIKLMEETLAQLKQSSSSASNAYEEALAAYSPERRIQQTADGPTRAFVDYVQHQPLIRAVLAGHVHHDFETRLPGGAMQLITGGGFRGCAREITFC